MNKLLLPLAIALLGAVAVFGPPRIEATMIDEFASKPPTLDGPAGNAAAITPNDSTVLPKSTRGLYVGTGGDLTVVTAIGKQTVTFPGVPGGCVLPIRAEKVLATDTTASGLVGLW